MEAIEEITQILQEVADSLHELKEIRALDLQLQLQLFWLENNFGKWKNLPAEEIQLNERLGALMDKQLMLLSRSIPIIKPDLFPNLYKNKNNNKNKKKGDNEG